MTDPGACAPSLLYCVVCGGLHRETPCPNAPRLPADTARSVERMLAKLDDDDRAAFNACIAMARMPATPLPDVVAALVEEARRLEEQAGPAWERWRCMQMAYALHGLDSRAISEWHGGVARGGPSDDTKRLVSATADFLFRARTLIPEIVAALASQARALIAARRAAEHRMGAVIWQAVNRFPAQAAADDPTEWDRADLVKETVECVQSALDAAREEAERLQADIARASRALDDAKAPTGDDDSPRVMPRGEEQGRPYKLHERIYWLAYSRDESRLNTADEPRRLRSRLAEAEYERDIATDIGKRLMTELHDADDLWREQHNIVVDVTRAVGGLPLAGGEGALALAVRALRERAEKAEEALSNTVHQTATRLSQDVRCSTPTSGENAGERSVTLEELAALAAVPIPAVPHE